MGLTDLDSNKYDALIRFKKSISTKTAEAELRGKSSLSVARKINEYGEIVASRIQQEQKRLNDEEINLLIAAYLGGRSTYALAKQFGCHRTTISDILKRHNVTVTNKKGLKKLNTVHVATV